MQVLQKIIRSIAVAPIRLYQLFVSPLLPPACRYSPTCSYYTHEAIMNHGVIKGGWLGVKRICSCHPFSKKEYYDPVPGTLKED